MSRSDNSISRSVARPRSGGVRRERCPHRHKGSRRREASRHKDSIKSQCEVSGMNAPQNGRSPPRAVLQCGVLTGHNVGYGQVSPWALPRREGRKCMCRLLFARALAWRGYRRYVSGLRFGARAVTLLDRGDRRGSCRPSRPAAAPGCRGSRPGRGRSDAAGVLGRPVSRYQNMQGFQVTDRRDALADSMCRQDVRPVDFGRKSRAEERVGDDGGASERIRPSRNRAPSPSADGGYR